jgi:hypothetical protein
MATNSCACGRIYDWDGFFEHGEETLFWCECGKVLEKSGFCGHKEIDPSQVDLPTKTAEEFSLKTFGGPHNFWDYNKGLFIKHSRLRMSEVTDD